MVRRVLWAVAVLLLLTGVAAAQMQEDYLDVFMVKVKPEKRAEFEAISKKVVEANRRHKGDDWIAMATAYGEGNTVYFISARKNYADIQRAYGAFMGAVNKAYGQAGATKIFQDFDNCLVSSRSEVRRRRWDLSANVPDDIAARTKALGEARWVRTAIVHVRPGHTLDFESQLKDIKAAAEKATPQLMSLVSQSAVGQQGTVFYISALRNSLGGFDVGPPLPQLLGGEGYRKFLSSVAESVESTETIINRILPELSNAPEEIASVAPEFWRPKPTAVARLNKPKPAEAAEKR